MIFGGDVVLARGVAQTMERTKQSPLRHLHDLFRSADLAFVNLESPFSDQPQLRTAEMIFRADPASISVLKDAGIGIVSTANNHVRDCGSRGIEFTLELLAKHGIAAVGTAATEQAAHQGQVLERNGVRFGFLAYTYDQANGNHTTHDPRICGLDISRMQQAVRTIKADAVIVSMHAGVEYATKPHPTQTAFARAAIDAGAKLVVGHHPHVIQPPELYKGGLILYSLGNLVFDQNPPATKKGLLATVTFEGPQPRTCDLTMVDIVNTAQTPAPGSSTLLL
jgi:poly-gamma-glutamate synthesis protein (capsule biosynthesis protein)